MKIKSHKASKKRFKVSATGKLMKRVNGQGHFNGRESGNTTRNKRTDFAIDKTVAKGLKALNPYV